MNNFRIVSADEYRTPRNKFDTITDSIVFDFINDLLNIRSSPKPVTPKKKIRDNVDGRFVAVVTSTSALEEAQKIVTLALKLKLTVDPQVGYLLPGEGLLFSGSLKYDVTKIRKEDNAKSLNFCVYDIESDYDVVKKAVKELAEENEKLQLQLGKEYVTGQRSIIPTYYELKINKEGEKLLDKKRRDKGVKQFTTKTECLCREDITISQNFIKVGLVFIPIKDNDVVHIYV